MAPRPTSDSFPTATSLTLGNLSSIAKRNNDEFLLAYHREQRRFRELYASTGRAETKSWSTLKGDSSHTSNLSAVSVPEKPGDFAFGTPVLKPRVPKLPTDVLATHVEPSKGSHLDADPSQAIEERKSLRPKNPRILQPANAPHEVTIGDKILPDANPSKTVKSRKRLPHGDSDTDEEHENRLAERRQRRKTKKAIIKPDLTIGVIDKEHAPKKREKKQTKAQTGFALMHGFSATNVGKNRLTLDPLIPRQSTGVFQKGKASNATKVLGPDAKKQQHITSFSESKFLSEKRGYTKHTTHNESPSACSSPKITPKKRSKRTPEKTLEPSEADAQSDHPSSSNEPRKSYNPDDSVVWDIEKDSRLPDSDESYPTRQGTVIVSFPKAVDCPQTKVDLGLGMVDRAKPVAKKTVGSALQDKCINHPVSVVSLGPSQSASQVGAKEIAPYYSSTYFKAVAQPSMEPPRQPTNFPLPKESPVHPSDIIGEVTSHPKTGLDSFSGLIEAQESAISTHEYEEGMAIDVSQDSILAFPNLAAAPQDYGPEPERSYWSEVDWDGCDDRRLSSSINVLDFPSNASDFYFGPEIGMAGLQSGTGDGIDVVRGYSMGSDHLWNNSSNPGGYDSPRCHSPSYLEDPYYPFIDGTVTDSDSVRDTSGPDALPPLACEAFDAPESELYVDLDAMSDGGNEEGGSYLASSVCSAFQEEDDSVEAHNDNFYQGRALLYGLNPVSGYGLLSNRLRGVEAEVAGLLKQNHWLPQKL